MEETKYSISEACDQLKNVSHSDVTHRTLHYYEKQLGITINRDASGNRVYNERDLELFRYILKLKDTGLKGQAIKNLLEERGLLKDYDDSSIVVVDENALNVKNFLINEIRTAVSKEVSGLSKEFNNIDDLLNQLVQASVSQEKLIDRLLSEREEFMDTIRDLKLQNDENYSNIDKKLADMKDYQEKALQPWYKKLFKTFKKGE